MLAAKFIVYTKTPLMVAVTALAALLLDFNATAAWAAPVIISLLGFIFLAGAVYGTLLYYQKRFDSLVKEAADEFKSIGTMKREIDDIKKLTNDLKENLPQGQFGDKRYRNRGYESR